MMDNQKNKTFYSRTLSRDLIIGLTLAIGIVLITLGILYYNYSTRVALNELDARAKYITGEFTKVLANCLWNLELDTVEQISQAYLNSETLVGVRVITSFDDEVFISLPKDKSNIISYKKNITKNNEKIGYAELFFSKSEILKSQEKMISAIIGVILSAIIVIIIGTYLIMKTLLNKPLVDLINGIRDIASGNYQSPLSSVPQSDINSIVREVNSMAEEISKRTEELAESEEKYRGIFENALEGIFQTTPDGKFISVNPSFAHILGYESPEDLIESIVDISTDIYADKTQRDILLQKLFHEGTVSNFECRQKRKDKEIIWVSIHGRVVYDSNNEIVHIEGLLEDITERKMAQEALENANRQLEKRVEERTMELKNANHELTKAKEAADAAAHAKSEFLANMSHEIRTPMNGVIAAADLALGEKLTPKTEHYLRIIHSSGHSLLGIINDILDFSKIDAGKLDIEESPFRLDEVIQRISDMFLNKTSEKEIEMLIDIEPETPMALLGDSLRIQQIITNLTGNAIKFTSPGGIISIGVSKVHKDDREVQLQFYVKDTGIGMKPEYLRRLFEPFTQADASTTRKYGGTGLGLTISKQLVELMGGHIWVESEYGEGTTFFFKANFKRQSQENELVLELPKDLSNLFVMVVDDTEDSRIIVRKILKSFGYKVKLVDSGSKAITMLNDISDKNTFDLIIMDWLMPEIDGIEVSKKIRNEMKLDIPIIMLTSFGKDSEKNYATEAGVNSFLTKPVNASSLYNAIMDVFGKEELKRITKDIENKGKLKQYKEHIKGYYVLVAEDNLTNQDIALAILEGAGLIVDIANNGQEALEKIKSKPYDAVLMDIQMPVMDGYEATRAIRKWELSNFNKNKQIKRLPVIAMTAHAMKGDDIKCLEAGMDGYVTKPINQNALFQTLWTFLKSKDKLTISEQIEQIKEIEEKNNLEKQNGFGDIFPFDPDIINTKQVFDKISLDADTYKNILIRFKKNNIETNNKIQKAFDDNNIELLKRIFHTLKGSSANVGALNLCNIASELENKTNQKEKSILFDLESINELKKEISNVIKQIELLEDTKPKNSNDNIQTQNNFYNSKEFDKDKFLIDLKQISESIEFGEPDNINKEVKKFQKYIKDDNSNNLYNSILESIEDFDYDEAMERVKALTNYFI